ncbi:hypothetical protein ACU610_08625 [Geodermatophilus sp. URMC 61]|uniref:hypothetical protein n=1 Tax=Geodermatophilus sp. URMC 61 TaxID=3423411 RepID=UPI00406C18F1
MTASTVSRRGERFDRARNVADLEQRAAVEHLLGDGGSTGGTGTGESLPEPDLPHIGGGEGAPDSVEAPPPEDREEGGTARAALSRITSRRHGDGHDVHPHRR